MSFAVDMTEFVELQLENRRLEARIAELEGADATRILTLDAILARESAAEARCERLEEALRYYANGHFGESTEQLRMPARAALAATGGGDFPWEPPEEC